jgi:hypothetical protein
VIDVKKTCASSLAEIVLSVVRLDMLGKIVTSFVQIIVPMIAVQTVKMECVIKLPSLVYLVVILAGMEQHV